MDRPAQMDHEHWKPDRVVFFKRPVYRAMIAAHAANEIIERMIRNAEDKKASQ
jgi:hypothetical protein